MKYPIVTGSQALRFYGLLKGRTPSDWDIILPHEKGVFHINNCIVDISDSNSVDEPTNNIIYENSQKESFIQSPLGIAKVVSLNLLKVMKQSSLPLNKIKNTYDLKFLEHIILSPSEEKILEERTKETLLKIEKQKSQFFNRYKIERYFDHDDLHLYINKDPFYKKILDNSSVEVSQDKFNQLTDSEKCMILWEESFVLALERFFVPRVRKYPMMIDLYCEQFFNVNKSSDPGLYWLNRLCTHGVVKDNPEWLSKWATDNFEILINGYSKWWDNTFDNLDEDFWIKLLKF